jgi:hypothetical protein
VVLWVSIDTGIETSSAEQAHLQQQVHPHCIMWVISLLPHIGTPSPGLKLVPYLLSPNLAKLDSLPSIVTCNHWLLHHNVGVHQGQLDEKPFLVTVSSFATIGQILETASNPFRGIRAILKVHSV